jgi:hypothetical protein
MRRHAGVRVAGLVAKACLKNMVARVRGHMRMQNKLARIHTELFPGRKLQGVLRTGWEVDRGHVETMRFDHREPSRDQGLIERCVRIDVQAVGHAEVKIDLGRAVRGNGHLSGREKLNRSGWVDPLARASGQWQGLVFYDLEQKLSGRMRPSGHRPGGAKRRGKPCGNEHGGKARHLFASSGQRLLDAGFHFIF